MLGRITFWISIYSILALQFVIGCASPSNSPSEIPDVSNYAPATVEIAAPENPFESGGQNAVPSDATDTYQYDQNGNLVEHEADGFIATYEYDVNLRIESQEVRSDDQSPGAGLKAEFIYDADGNKIATIGPDEDQIYTDSSVRLVQKGTAPATYRMTYGHSETNEAGDADYFVKDHLGSPLAVATSDRFVEVKDTTPFGGAWYEVTNGNENTDYAFNGNIEEGIPHDGVKLLDYNARHMAQNAGRFLQADTVIPNSNAPIGYNRYAYVNNNPVRFIDPTGHMADESGRDWWVSPDTPSHGGGARWDEMDSYGDWTPDRVAAANTPGDWESQVAAVTAPKRHEMRRGFVGKFVKWMISPSTIDPSVTNEVVLSVTGKAIDSAANYIDRSIQTVQRIMDGEATDEQIALLELHFGGDISPERNTQRIMAHLRQIRDGVSKLAAGEIRMDYSHPNPRGKTDKAIAYIHFNEPTIYAGPDYFRRGETLPGTLAKTLIHELGHLNPIDRLEDVRYWGEGAQHLSYSNAVQNSDNFAHYIWHVGASTLSNQYNDLYRETIQLNAAQRLIPW